MVIAPSAIRHIWNLCNLISSDTVLAHFDPSLPTQVRHDAYKIGLSGALT